jgi:hypothetical protein
VKVLKGKRSNFKFREIEKSMRAIPGGVSQGIPIPEWERSRVCKHEVVGERENCRTMLCLNRKGKEKQRAAKAYNMEGKTGIIWGR